MSRWHDMTGEEQVEAIRAGYIAGQSAARIGVALGTTRNAVLGRAWRMCLTPSNAAVWSRERLQERIEARRLVQAGSSPGGLYVHRGRKPVVHGKDWVLKMRKRLKNKATDPATRSAVDKINALACVDEEIAETMGVSKLAIVNWRRGKHSMSAFSLSLVDETVARLS